MSPEISKELKTMVQTQEHSALSCGQMALALALTDGPVRRATPLHLQLFCSYLPLKYCSQGFESQPELVSNRVRRGPHPIFKGNTLN